MIKIGDVLDKRYRVIDKVGQGGMSTVYLAMDNRLNKQWAIKEIKKTGSPKNDKVIMDSLIEESNFMKRLDHAFLPRIVDVIEQRDTFCVIMDFIEGAPLSQILHEYGPQEEADVIEWGKQLCDVLDYLHTRPKPIVYRDMKPSNIMLRPEGNIKLFDLGIAREYDPAVGCPYDKLATPRYSPPEQREKGKFTDARSDVYSLGMTLYHLLTGQTLEEGNDTLIPIRQINPQFSVGFERILQKATKPNPAERYQSCAEMLYELEHYQELSDDYRNRQKKKLRGFFASSIGAVLSLVVGVTCSIAAVQLNNSNYNTQIALADVAPTAEESIVYLQSAIAIKPAELTAYENLVVAFKEDADFTVEEQAILQQTLSVNLETLQSQNGYADLAFEVGKLYWFYYSYGQTEDSDNQITRMKSAITWFNDVIEYGGEDFEQYQMAVIYRDIGVFNRDITLNIEEAADKGVYSPYWENLTQLIEMVEETGESEIVLLELYRLAANSIENYAKKFKADDVPQEEMQALYETVVAQTELIDPMTDKTEALKEYLTERFPYVSDAISLAYAS